MPDSTDTALQEAELRRRWGADFSANLEKTDRVAAAMGLQSEDAKTIVNHARFREALLRIDQVLDSARPAAQQTRDAMMHDPATAQALRNGSDPALTKKWDDTYRVGADLPPTRLGADKATPYDERKAADLEMDRLGKDPDFRKRLLAGEAKANAQWTKLQEQRDGRMPRLRGEGDARNYWQPR